MLIMSVHELSVTFYFTRVVCDCLFMYGVFKTFQILEIF